jgi:hypothetical protein
MQPRSLVWPARDGLRCLPGGLPNNRYAPTIRGGATSLQGAVGEVGGAAREAVGEGGAVSHLTEGVGEATQRVGDAAGQVVG